MGKGGKRRGIGRQFRIGGSRRGNAPGGGVERKDRQGSRSKKREEEKRKKEGE